MPSKHLLTNIIKVSLLVLAACAQKVDSSSSKSTGYEFIRDQSHTSSDSICAPGTFNAGIVGGEKVQKSSRLGRSVVFILQNDAHHTSSCSGTLIDRNIILTAAHCVDQSVNSPQNVSVYFSNQPDCDKVYEVLEPKKRLAEAIIIHPSWNSAGTHMIGHGDLALVRIEGNAPASAQTIRLSSDFLMAPTVPVLLAGFGLVTPDYNETPTAPISLRAAFTHPITAEQRDHLASLTSGDRNPSSLEQHEYDNLPSNELFYIDQTHGDGICGGDSGGPSLIKNSNNDYVQVGVASFVLNPYNINLLCGYAGAHTNVLFMKDWIEKSFSQIKNDYDFKDSPFQ